MCRLAPLEAANSPRHLSPVAVPGQYHETCDGSSSSVTINTTDIPLGAEIMEVMVYRKRERRKYSPLTVDNTVFYVTGRGGVRPVSSTEAEFRTPHPLTPAFRQDPSGGQHLPEGRRQPVGERFLPRPGRGLQSPSSRPQRLPENRRRHRLHLGLQGRQPAGDAPQRDRARLQPAGHHEREAGGGGGVPGGVPAHLCPRNRYLTEKP